MRRALQPVRLAIKRQRDFVADVAHELRTPLAIQRTVAEVGLTDPDSSRDELQATLEQVLGENRHLTRLVEDLSLLARTDTDAVSIERRPVDLSRLVTGTAEEISYLAGEKGITLDADVQGKVTVLGDILWLRQLLLILLDNALKHTLASGAVRAALSADSGRARLEVADSGQGIDPADLPRIFDRFYRADQARTGEGTGLGLAIAKWSVEAHGGQIQARNVSPRGAAFTVTLPVTRGSRHLEPSRSIDLRGSAAPASGDILACDFAFPGRVVELSRGNVGRLQHLQTGDTAISAAVGRGSIALSARAGN